MRSGCEAKVVCLAGRASALHDTYRCLASRCQNGQEAGLPSEAVLCYIVNVRTFHSPCSSSYYVVVAIATSLEMWHACIHLCDLRIIKWRKMRAKMLKRCEMKWLLNRFLTANRSSAFAYPFSFFCFSVCEKSVDITPLCNASDLPSHFGLEDHKVNAATMS